MTFRSLFPGLVLPVLFAMAASNPASAQDTLIVVFGTVKDLTSNEPLTDFHVEAMDLKWGRRVLAIVYPAGRYELDLMQEGDFIIEYSAPGHVPKRVRVDMRGPTVEEWLGGYGMNVDVRLFREVDGLDLTLGSEPFGICRYDSVADIFSWDLAYIESMRERMKGALAEYEKRFPSTPTVR